jgi:hypothetical protein
LLLFNWYLALLFILLLLLGSSHHLTFAMRISAVMWWSVVLVAAVSFDVLTYQQTFVAYMCGCASVNARIVLEEYRSFLCRSAISNLPHGNLIEGN